ncbi:MAG: neuromedin U [Deltaproteobacteria bacterium]|nr:neuromedin U [Deltaproteobacteria bacterium]
MRRSNGILCLGLTLAILINALPVKAQENEKDLAQKSQNPVSDLISLPLQNNTTFTTEPGGDVQNVLNIQPVIPVKVGPLNIINRIILPIVSQPEVVPGGPSAFGMGDINYQLFFSPAKSNHFIWGVGPIAIFPTGTDVLTGQGKLSIGPTAVALGVMGPWVGGLLINNVWSVAGDNTRSSVNQMLMQPFVNYNLPHGWFVTTSPILTANWEAPNSNRWLVPIGAGGGKILKIGSQPINLNSQMYYNALRPKGVGEVTWRVSLAFLFPKKP